jgi:7-cyano-7-deazaguanine synthase
MDSSTLLLNLLANDYQVTALSFDYGQKHNVELERATELVEYINDNRQCGPEADQFWYSLVKHQIIKIDGLGQLLNSTLVEGGADVPEGHYAEENMKSTVVPNRNKIFSSIIQAVALSITEQNKSKCVIAMGIHAGDHAIYPDCRQEFRDADMEAFKIGNWDSELVTVTTPYLELNKFDILEDGLKSCEKLRLDFDEIYKRTNTSYKPIKLSENYWVSDFKSAASVERVEAFIKLGRPDPAQYGELLENGDVRTVKWEEVKQRVQEVLDAHNS